MMMKRLRNSLYSILLAAAIICSVLSPAAYAAKSESGVIRIGSAEELTDFAAKCSLDTWSQGKTVLLTEDIDLSGESFSPIPTFGGTFDGQSHSISGLSLSGAGSAMGLFRYIQEGGVVKNLDLLCTVSPSGSQSEVGGIVGRNNGTVMNCTVSGAVIGDNKIGGIAGINSESGMIRACSVTGSVTGKSRVGGVAGVNLGTILGCSNSGSVNTSAADTDISFSGLDTDEIIDQFTSTSSSDANEGSSVAIADEADIGGIAGYSSGIIQSCSNEGEIGYPHIGYNIGGIAGRQSGYIDSCTNSGVISGRKDVGGIVGQAEPYIVIDPDSSTLERLSDELNRLNSLSNGALDDVDAASSDISGRLSVIGDYADSARDSTKKMSDELTDFLNNNVGEINSLISLIYGYADQTAEALEDLQYASDYLSQTFAQLTVALKTLQSASENADAAFEDASSAADDLSKASDWLKEAADDLSPVINELKDAVEGATSVGDIDMDKVKDALSKTDEALDDLEKAADYLGKASDHLKDSMDHAQDASADMTEALKQLQTVSSTASVASSYFSKAFANLKEIAAGLAKADPVEFSKLSDDFRQNSDDLYASMIKLSNEISGLNNSLKSNMDILTNDLRAISNQFNLVMQLLVSAIGDIQDSASKDLSDIISDTSEVNLSGTKLGKISNCENSGVIAADRSVGGIAGSMAIEQDLDPEDDYTIQFSFFSMYESKAILQSNINRGDIVVKKDCGGGICGRIDIGTAISCQNYGYVKSTDGDYVGGIAGQSGSAIRKCYSKCSLSGRDYVGGIAGFGTKISDSSAIVKLDNANEFMGAIAGSAEIGADKISGNRFVDTGWAGIDSISYSGMAEPTSFDELKKIDSVPAEFVSFNLTLCVDGQELKVIPFAYGDNLSMVELPDVPEKEGYYGEWPEFDTSGISSDIKLEAVYTPWVTVLSSDATAENGSLALALAEGSYTEEAKLFVSESSLEAPVEAQADEDLCVWKLKIENSEVSKNDEVTVRLLNIGGGKATVWRYEDGAWVEVAARSNGKYLITSMTGTEGSFCVLSTDGAYSSITVLLAALGVLLILIAYIVFKAIRKRKAKQTADK